MKYVVLLILRSIDGNDVRLILDELALLEDEGAVLGDVIRTARHRRSEFRRLLPLSPPPACPHNSSWALNQFRLCHGRTHIARRSKKRHNLRQQYSICYADLFFESSMENNRERTFVDQTCPKSEQNSDFGMHRWANAANLVEL